jgi:hypothetical protein
MHWYDFWTNGGCKGTNCGSTDINKFGTPFSDLWNDEIQIKKHLDDIEETDSYKFYKELWDRYNYKAPQHKKEIEKLLNDYTNKYNEWASDYREKQRTEKEIEDIVNTHEKEFNGVNVTYKVEKPPTQLVNRFIQKSGESEEEANRKLLTIVDIDLPQKKPEGYGEDWENWVKNYYNVFFKKYIEPWAEKNNYRLWGY